MLFLLQAFTQAVPYHARQVPADSFFVLSIKGKKVIADSSLNDSLTWGPILNDWSKNNPTLQEFSLIQTPVE